MTISDGDVLRASARWSGPNAQDIVNVWYFQADFTTTDTDEDVFDAVDTFITRVFLPFDDDLSTDMTPVDLKVDIVDFVGGKWVVTHNVGFGPWGAGITTTEASDNLPPGAAAVGFLYTALGKHQGRKFFGGFTEDGSSGSGSVDSTMQTRILLGLAQLLIDEIVQAGNNLVSVVPDTVFGIPREVLAVALNATWGYQRRRRQGVGS